MIDLQLIHHLERTLADLNQRPDADIHQQIAALNDLSWALSDTDAARACALAECALTLATALPDGNASYRAGMAPAKKPNSGCSAPPS